MLVTYVARSYSSDRPVKRYVQNAGRLGYKWIEQDVEHKRFDVRQGIVDANELPADVKAKADEREGFYPSYVEWPHA